MTSFLLVSAVILWFAVLLLAVGLFGLARQIGLLYNRLPQTGARILDAGPEIGTLLEPVEVMSVRGEPLMLPPPLRTSLLVFMSTGCPACVSLAPAVVGFAENPEGLVVRVVMSGIGEAEARTHAETLGLAGFTARLSPYEVRERYALTLTPYALIVGADARVQAKGHVLNREQLDSLLTAIEMDTPSLQTYVQSKRELFGDA